MIINQLRINMGYSKRTNQNGKGFLEKGRDAIFLQVMLESNQLQRELASLHYPCNKKINIMFHQFILNCPNL